MLPTKIAGQPQDESFSHPNSGGAKEEEKRDEIRALIKREILFIGTRLLMLSILVALMVFYGLVFWHWQNDAKRRGASWNARKEGSKRSPHLPDSGALM